MLSNELIYHISSLCKNTLGKSYYKLVAANNEIFQMVELQVYYKILTSSINLT